MDASLTTPSEEGLGSYIRQLRRAAQISQSKLAGQVGIDVTYLSKLENGKQGASDQVLRSLAAALDVSATRMLLLAGKVPEEFRMALVVKATEAARMTFTTETGSGTHLLAPPRYLTQFTDRVQEIKHFHQVWRPGTVITISGPPGCGKSRLAAQVTGRLEADRLAVTWLPVQEGEDSDRIRALLMAGDTAPGSVVVLDNADLSLEASADVARRLVYGNSGVTVIATSRQPLGIHGEQLLRLEGLPIPDLHLRPSGAADGPTPDLEKLQSQESLSLFSDRARLAEPGFQLDMGNAAAVFDICRWLDGLPLAIELAALRLRHMTVGDLADKLDDPRMLTLLAGNTLDVPERHSSLEKAIGWSFDKLSADQRTIAIRLSRFSTPFRQADAAQVASDDVLSEQRVVATVLELVDRSLLLKQEDRDHHAIYRWPRPVQQFGLRELGQGPDRTRTEDRYASLCMRFVRSLRHHRSLSEADWIRLADLSPDMIEVIERMPEREREEALAALRGAWPNLLRFGNRGSQGLGERLARSQLDVFGEPAIQARNRGDYDAAHDHYRTAHEHASERSDPLAQADTLLDLAQNAVDRARYEDAEKNLQEAGELYEQLGNLPGIAEVQNLWGTLRLIWMSDHAGAEELFLEALRLAQQQESRRLEAYSLNNLGLCDCLRRRVVSARSRLAQSLGIRDHMRNLRGVARVIEVFAIVESEAENHPVALQLLGAAHQYRHSSQTLGRPVWWRERLERVEEEARSALASTPGEAEGFLRLGAATSLSDAGELAQQDISAVLRGPLGEPHSKSLRRAAPQGWRSVGPRAGAWLESHRGDPATPLEVTIQSLREGADLASEVRRGVRGEQLLALGDPDGASMEDLLCFSVAPDRHRGVIVPVFTRAATLAQLLERNPTWGSKPVLTVSFDQLRSTLVPGETVVVNPWTPSEYRWSTGEEGYLPADESLTST
jgi:predicted ATPase/transcriptional regulator with XRE-family HTH domain